MKVFGLLALSLLTLNPSLGRAQTTSAPTLTIEQAIDDLDRYRDYVVHAPARDTLHKAARSAEFGLFLIGVDAATHAWAPAFRQHVRAGFGADPAEFARQIFTVTPFHYGMISRVGTAIVAGSVVYAGVRFVAIGLRKLFGRPATTDEARQMRKFLALPKKRQLELARNNPRLASAVIELAQIMRGQPEFTAAPVIPPPPGGVLVL